MFICLPGSVIMYTGDVCHGFLLGSLLPHAQCLSEASLCNVHLTSASYFTTELYTFVQNICCFVSLFLLLYVILLATILGNYSYLSANGMKFYYSQCNGGIITELVCFACVCQCEFYERIVFSFVRYMRYIYLEHRVYTRIELSCFCVFILVHGHRDVFTGILFVFTRLHENIFLKR